MGKKYLLDTNIAIYLKKGVLNIENSSIIADAAKFPAQLSIITKIEILGWNASTKEEANEYKKICI